MEVINKHSQYIEYPIMLQVERPVEPPEAEAEDAEGEIKEEKQEEAESVK